MECYKDLALFLFKKHPELIDAYNIPFRNPTIETYRDFPFYNQLDQVIKYKIAINQYDNQEYCKHMIEESIVRLYDILPTICNQQIQQCSPDIQIPCYVQLQFGQDGVTKEYMHYPIKILEKDKLILDPILCDLRVFLEKQQYQNNLSLDEIFSRIDLFEMETILLMWKIKILLEFQFEKFVFNINLYPLQHNFAISRQLREDNKAPESIYFVSSTLRDKFLTQNFLYTKSSLTLSINQALESEDGIKVKLYNVQPSESEKDITKENYLQKLEEFDKSLSSYAQQQCNIDGINANSLFKVQQFESKTDITKEHYRIHSAFGKFPGTIDESNEKLLSKDEQFGNKNVIKNDYHLLQEFDKPLQTQGQYLWTKDESNEKSLFKDQQFGNKNEIKKEFHHQLQEFDQDLINQLEKQLHIDESSKFKVSKKQFYFIHSTLCQYTSPIELLEHQIIFSEQENPKCIKCNNYIDCTQYSTLIVCPSLLELFERIQEYVEAKESNIPYVLYYYPLQINTIKCTFSDSTIFAQLNFINKQKKITSIFQVLYRYANENYDLTQYNEEWKDKLLREEPEENKFEDFDEYGSDLKQQISNQKISLQPDNLNSSKISKQEDEAVILDTEYKDIMLNFEVCVDQNTSVIAFNDHSGFLEQENTFEHDFQQEQLSDMQQNNSGEQQISQLTDDEQQQSQKTQPGCEEQHENTFEHDFQQEQLSDMQSNNSGYQSSGKTQPGGQEYHEENNENNLSESEEQYQQAHLSDNHISK